MGLAMAHENPHIPGSESLRWGIRCVFGGAANCLKKARMPGDLITCAVVGGRVDPCTQWSKSRNGAERHFARELFFGEEKCDPRAF